MNNQPVRIYAIMLNFIYINNNTSIGVDSQFNTCKNIHIHKNRMLRSSVMVHPMSLATLQRR